MQEFHPIDFTKLCLQDQVKVVTVREPSRIIVKHGKVPYVLLAFSLVALGSMVVYYKSLVNKKEEELRRMRLTIKP